MRICLFLLNSLFLTDINQKEIFVIRLACVEDFYWNKFKFVCCTVLRSNYTIVTKRLTQMLKIVGCLYRFRQQQQQQRRQQRQTKCILLDDKCFGVGNQHGCCNSSRAYSTFLYTASVLVHNSHIHVCAISCRVSHMNRSCSWSFCICFFFISSSIPRVMPTKKKEWISFS